MIEPVRLVVPRDARFREIAPDMAARYCAAAGGAGSDAALLESAVATASDQLAAQATEAVEITLDFAATDDKVNVTLQCGSQTSVVSVPLPAGRAS